MLGATLSLALSACGGGGGDTGAGNTSPAPAVSKWPSSGHYSVVLKASGSTADGETAVALSLVHPSTPQVEYVIDSTAASSTLGMILYRGTHSATGNPFSALSPVAYVDAPGGTLRTTLLSANGARPLQSTGSTQALCPGNVVANNFTDPFASVIVAGTPGADGICGTGDDNQLMISFSSTGAPSATAVTGYLGFLRSSVSGAPSNWLTTDASGAETVLPIGTGGTALAVGVGTPGATVTYAPVENLDDTILYSRNGALMGVGNGSGSIVRAALSSSTGPDGWKSAGNDATHAYAYLNSNTATSGTGTWRLLAISRVDLSVSTLATGTGSLLLASTVPGAVYATVLDGASGSYVTQVSTPTGAQTTLWPSATSITGVEANSAGLNTVFTVSGSASTAALSLIDDEGNSFFSANPGLVYGADGDTIDAAGNLAFAGVYIVSPSSSTYLGGVPLTRIDAATKASVVLGTLPTGSDLGGTASDTVFAIPVSGDPAFGGFFAARLSATQIISSGSAVYTFDPSRANSVVRTTSQVQ